MSIEDARRRLTFAVEEARAGWPVGWEDREWWSEWRGPVTPGNILIQYENRLNVDTQKQHDPWMDVKFHLMDAYQGDLADRPFHRHIGVMELSIHIKEGQGTSKPLMILEHFYHRLQRKQFGNVRTHFMDARPSQKVRGWHIASVGIGYWFDVTY